MKPIQIGAFRIRVRPDSQTTFQVTGPRLPGESRRTRKSFDSLDEARRKATEWDDLVRQRRAVQKGPDLRMAPTWLEAAKLREAESLYSLLATDERCAGRTLTEIFQAGLGTRPVKSKPLATIIDEFLLGKKAENVEARTYSALDSVLHQFLARHSVLTVETLRSFVNEKGYKEAGAFVDYSPTTRRNRRTQVGQLVRWCAAEGYIAEDFMDRVKSPRQGDNVQEIVTLTAEEAWRFLEAARKIEGGKLYPYLVLATWAGCRPGELEGLRPSQVDLVRGVVEVGKLRTQTHRFHRLAPVAVHLLQQFGKLDDFLPIEPIGSPKFRRLFALVRGAAGLVDEWVPDTLRHTYISFAVPLLGATDVAGLAGNSVPVINRHYRSPKHADDVAEFWCRGWPSGARLLAKLNARATEEWLKSPNAFLHGVPPCRVELGAAEGAIAAALKAKPGK